MGSSSQVMLGGVARNVCREGRILSSGSPTSLIPTSLAFLSTTSSSEAQEALKHVDRLDRNRDGTKRLNYAIVGPSELATVNKLLYATYHPYEPLQPPGLVQGAQQHRRHGQDGGEHPGEKPDTDCLRPRNRSAGGSSCQQLLPEGRAWLEPGAGAGGGGGQELPTHPGHPAPAQA